MPGQSYNERARHEANKKRTFRITKSALQLFKLYGFQLFMRNFILLFIN